MDINKTASLATISFFITLGLIVGVRMDQNTVTLLSMFAMAMVVIAAVAGVMIYLSWWQSQQRHNEPDAPRSSPYPSPQYPAPEVIIERPYYLVGEWGEPVQVDGASYRLASGYSLAELAHKLQTLMPVTVVAVKWAGNVVSFYLRINAGRNGHDIMGYKPLIASATGYSTIDIGSAGVHMVVSVIDRKIAPTVESAPLFDTDDDPQIISGEPLPRTPVKTVAVYRKNRK